MENKPVTLADFMQNDKDMNMLRVYECVQSAKRGIKTEINMNYSKKELHQVIDKWLDIPDGDDK